MKMKTLIAERGNKVLILTRRLETKFSTAVVEQVENVHYIRACVDSKNAPAAFLQHQAITVDITCQISENA